MFNNFIEEKIKNKFSFFLFLKKKINDTIFINNIKIIEKILKRNKKNFLYKDLLQESYITFKNIINSHYNNKIFFKFCYWKINERIKILAKNKNKKKLELLSIDKPLFNNTLKYYKENKEDDFEKNHDIENLKINIRKAISKLSKREQKIIRLRFGIGVKVRATLEEIGRIFCLTKERIRQIELKIILKIRQSEESEVLKPYVKVLKKEEY